MGLLGIRVSLALLVWLAFPETVLKVAHWFADKGR